MTSRRPASAPAGVVELVQVDAFTRRPFQGNPAAVCVLGPGQSADDAWMQAVAKEMNLSETAFLWPRDDGGFDLRWLTPAAEVDLCGHATLASAHVLWQDGHLPLDRPVRFVTRSGLLTAERRPGGAIALDFPAEPAAPTLAPLHLAEALGVEPTWVGKNRMDYLVEIDDAEQLRALLPDVRRLRAVDTRGVIVTARAATGAYDFVTRFFAPAVGVDEDPVTGSAFCGLGPYWGEKLGKDEVLGHQASARGGDVRVELRGERVILVGEAVTVMRCELVAGLDVGAPGP